jgi:DNA polymerase-4
MFTTRSYPRAIVHFDGDSFFAAIEQSLDHTLRGKAVVTGGERGAATSVSYEGKRLGLSRGMSLRDMRRICPDLVVVTSDYTAYSIYARRMYAIVREFTPDVEEYSIDECFADITGLRQKYRMPYEKIAALIHQRLMVDLGITFGAGLAPNKSLAKIASKHNKPAGLTCIPGKEIHHYLERLPIGSLWGMGQSTSVYLEKLGVHTALEFAEKSDGWLSDNHISKPYRDIWLELRGAYVRPLSTGTDESIGSILKSFTFKPSRDRTFILSQLAKNVEGACAKARRHGVKGKIARFYLKNQEFQYSAYSFELSVPLNDPREFLGFIAAHFDMIFIPGIEYRASGFGLYAITAEHAVTADLFGESVRIMERKPSLDAMDGLNKKFGSGTIFLGESMQARQASEQRSEERAKRSRIKVTVGGAKRRKSLSIPYLGLVH